MELLSNVTTGHLNVYDPYTAPAEFCGVVIEGINQYYQAQLVQQFGFYLFAGFFCGLLAGYAFTMWYLGKKGRLLEQNNVSKQ